MSDNDKKWCVYVHTNKINGKKYVGITSRRPEDRWDYGCGYRGQTYFYRAIQKYGWDNFKHEVLLTNETKEYACAAEKCLIKAYASNNPKYGYNLSSGGEAGAAGIPWPEERRKALSDKFNGRKLSEVFTLMQKRAVEALSNGQNVVYDATSITRKDRAGIIAACPKFAKIECHVIFAPIEICIERDAARERTVGKEVIDRMLKRFQAPYYDENIHEIKIVWNTPDDFNQETYVNNLINASDIPHDNPHHTLNIKDHCDEAYRHAVNHHFPSYLLMAAKYHDIGKPYVKAFLDSKGNPSESAHYYQHQCISAYMYYGIDKHNFFIAWLISTHMDPYINTKYYNKLPAYLKKQVDLLHEADINAH